jgi:uncharacterized protein YjdB
LVEGGFCIRLIFQKIKKKGEKQMNIKKISIGLLFLILALVFVPGSMATPSKITACTNCHDLGLSLGITNIAIATTTVAPSQVFNVDVTWTGGDSLGSTTVKWLTISANNNQFSFNPVQRDGGASAGTASFAVTAPATPGTYTIGVYTTSGPNTMMTDYKEVVITVSKPVVVSVLTSITVSPATANIIVGATRAFTATPKDQNGNTIAATLTWTSSNTTVGNVDATGKFTAATAGTATIKAANGSVNGTATVTVTSSTRSKYYIVTFIVTDSVTGKPIKDAKVSIDGANKETDRSGIVVFKHVSSGKQTYKINAEHYTNIKGSIEVGSNLTISVKLVPIKEKDDKKHDEKDIKEQSVKKTDTKHN